MQKGKRLTMWQGGTIWALLGLTLALGIPSGVPVAWAQEELFVGNNSNSSVTVYSRTANGNIAPIRTLAGTATGLSGPTGLAVDTVHDELVVANTDNAVTVYNRTASGSPVPNRELSGAATGIASPQGLAVDTVNDELVVANAVNNSLRVFNRTDSGNTTPKRVLSGAGPPSGISGPRGVVVDTVHDELVVASAFNTSVRVFNRTASIASGDTAPIRTLFGVATGLSSPWGLAVDTVNNELVVVNEGNNSVTVYDRTASGNTAPKRTLVGAATGLSIPRGVAVNTVNDELVVTNASPPSVTVYSRTASGNTPPIRTLAGGGTGLAGPDFLAVIPPLRTKTFTVPPCRVLDTRLSTPLGPIPANGTRSVLVAGDLTGGHQGGATTCAVPDAAAGVFVNVVAVNAEAPGHLTIYPFNTTQPLASTLNFATGQTIANGVLVPICTPAASCGFDLNITMGPAGAHLVIDITGYVAPLP